MKKMLLGTLVGLLIAMLALDRKYRQKQIAWRKNYVAGQVGRDG